jgi:hypothetical protein
MENEPIKLKIRDENAPEKIAWQVKEPQFAPKSREWLWALGIFAVAIIIFSILFKNYLFIVIVGLAAFIIYVLKGKEADFLNFRLDDDGLHIENKFYPYENFESFWIFPAQLDDWPAHVEREFVFRYKKHFMPLLIIPFHHNDESQIRKILSKYLEENEEKESLIDLLRKRFF